MEYRTNGRTDELNEETNQRTFRVMECYSVKSSSKIETTSHMNNSHMASIDDIYHDTCGRHLWRLRWTRLTRYSFSLFNSYPADFLFVFLKFQQQTTNNIIFMKQLKSKKITQTYKIQLSDISLTSKTCCKPYSSIYVIYTGIEAQMLKQR